ncbi:MAG: hypothetical protein MHMPM18_001309 [Marteilia pararefringens]
MYLGFGNASIRIISSAAIILIFIGAFVQGPLAILCLFSLIVSFGFKELMDIPNQKHKAKVKKFNTALYWLIFYTILYFSAIRLFLFHTAISRVPNLALHFLLDNHILITMFLCQIILILFILDLSEGLYKQQFLKFGYAVITTLFCMITVYLVIRNLFRGYIWIALPIILVAINDIFAYIFGRLIGRTQLIKLSPKKTVEGFISSAIITIIASFFIPFLMTNRPALYCPIKLFNTQFENGSIPYLKIDTGCKKAAIFINKTVSVCGFHINMSPFNLHAIVIGTFVSIVGPFGGFMASGFKRAYKIKDFSDLIPGHGGIFDRIDCQILVQMFVFGYSSAFIK